MQMSKVNSSREIITFKIKYMSVFGRNKQNSVKLLYFN